MGFVGNLSLFAAAKEFCTSIKNWHSFFDLQCILNVHIPKLRSRGHQINRVTE